MVPYYAKNSVVTQPYIQHVCAHIFRNICVPVLKMKNLKQEVKIASVIVVRVSLKIAFAAA
jgi:hypothetical protein